MQPLEFQPVLKRARWGGRRLGTVLGKPIGLEADYAESWEIADLAARHVRLQPAASNVGDESFVARGEFAGWPLSRLVAERNAELFGRQSGLEQFPLLVKFLDANDRLSVQVHPDDQRAQRLDPPANGKTEAWIIIGDRPGGVVYAGLNEGVDRGALRRAVEDGTVDQCLHRIPVLAGDCVFIPAGTVHAIGEGLLLAEIQQPSDVTFRLYDWGRVDADGQPRPLHVEEALECTDFARGPIDPVEPALLQVGDHRIEELVRCPYFELRRHVTRHEFTIPAVDHFRVLMMLHGHARWQCGGDEREFPHGRTVLVPAAAPQVRIVPQSEVHLLEAFVP
ncbi:MAG TPA: type I phosphomannose isomerase catalytic subunit [Planctomycetaceae bacterium]|nr:type I phosphomannose isomerase catalytic subunit [Planctomycetaceae bacterium]